MWSLQHSLIISWRSGFIVQITRLLESDNIVKAQVRNEHGVFFPCLLNEKVANSSVHTVNILLHIRL